MAAPLYFVGDTPQGPRLFREFQQVEADNPVDEALALLAPATRSTRTTATLLPGGSSRRWLQATTRGDRGRRADVDWPERPGGHERQEAKLAVQQVVYTVQGVLQRAAAGRFVATTGCAPVSGSDIPTGGFKAAPQNNVLAFVNVTQPEQDSQPGATFTASGVANSFEATVPWEIRDESGAKVLEGFATAEGWGDHLYPWESEVDVSGLAPGTYTFVAMTDDPSDGEGAGPTEDTKTFTLSQMQLAA